VSGPRRGRRLAAGTVAGVVLAGAAWWVAARPGAADQDRSGGAVATATAAVARRTLRAKEQVQGRLGYGDAHTVHNRRQGTITDLPDEGAVVRRGQALYRVDGKPAQLFYGRLAAWRELSLGVDDGPDERQLEQNLVALGYDPDRPSPSTTTSPGRRGRRCGAGRRSSASTRPGPSGRTTPPGSPARSGSAS
jgi:hypothetical protein